MQAAGVREAHAAASKPVKPSAKSLKGAAARSSQAAAQKLARSSDAPVEITGMRGEAREVYAEPDGSFTAVEHLQPVRTRRDGKWVDLDTTLKKRSDGTVAPVATTAGMSFSGGGTGKPLASIERAGRTLSLSWPGSLPEPSLEGSTATYKDVIAGVDLQVRADVDGFSHVFVVKTREAAQSPQLAQLKFTTAVNGVTVKEDSDGGVVATDNGSGGTVFEAPQPVMWDSTRTTDPSAPKEAPSKTPKMAGDVADPADGAAGSSNQAPIDVQVSPNALTLTPDAKMLADPGTTFPVYIDPVYKTPRSSHRLMVSSGGWEKYDFKDDEGMGYCPYSYTNDCGTHHVKRLFYQMPTSGFGGKTILSAEFQVKETFAPSCSSRKVQLWKAKAFGKSSTWSSTKDNWLDQLDVKDEAKGYSGCPAGDVILDATSAMKEAASKTWSSLTLGLRAATEDDQLGWKRFADDAYLRVHYNTPPPQPDTKKLSSSPGGPCSASPVKINRAPKLQAVLYDADKEDPKKLTGYFEAAWDDASGKHHLWDAKSGPKASGSPFSVTMPTTIPQNTKIGWSVRSNDGTSYSPWSYAGNATGCYFIYDPNTLPAPTITSTDYPESNPDNEADPWIDGVGKYGTFTFTGGSKSVNKYTYGFAGDPAGTQTKPTSAGAAQSVPIMPTHDGLNILNVTNTDAAGNSSSDTYYIRVSAGADPKAVFDLNEPIDSTHVNARIRKESGDSSDPDPMPATVHGGVTLGGEGVTSTSMQMNGTDGYAATSGPLIGTDKSFAISVWARLPETKPTHAAVVATQGASMRSGFEMYYSSALDRWRFYRYSADTADAHTVIATSANAPDAGEWNQLIGVYDAPAKQVRLYVNGVLSQSTPYDGTNWDAKGPFQIGTGSYNATPGSFFSGDIDDVRVFDRVVTSQEAQDLFVQKPAVAARWKFNDGGTPVSAAASYWKLDEAKGASRAEDVLGKAPAGAHGGVTFGITGKVGKAMHLDSSTGYAETSGPVVDTTKSFSVSAWARLTSTGGTPVVLSQEGSVGSAFQLYYSENYDRWIFNMQTPDSMTPTYVRAQDNAPPALNAWTHLTGVYDATAQTISLYVNGVLKSTVAQPNTFNGAGPVNIGRFKSKGAYTSYFNGDIDETRIFDHAITGSEAAQLAGTTPDGTVTTADDTLFGNHMTMAGNAHIDQSNAWVGDGALSLQDNGYAATSKPVIRTGQSFTVAGWVDTGSVDPSHDMAIFSEEGKVNSAFTVRYKAGSSDGTTLGGYQIDIPDKDTADATHQIVAHSNYHTNGDWDHIAIVYDAFANKVTLYVNGNLEASEDGPVSYRDNTLTFAATGPFQVGRTKTNSSEGEYWSGAIDDVWAYNGAADQDQIIQLASGSENPTYPDAG